MQERAGVYGARLTGGGVGGAVMAMTKAQFDEHGASTVAEAYHAKFGSRPDVLRCATAEGARVLAT